MTSSSVSTLGSRIAFVRKLRRMSQGDLAGPAKLAVSSLCRIETDKTQPRVSTLNRIARALDLPPGAFMDSASLMVHISSSWSTGLQPAGQSESPRTVQPVARWLSVVHVEAFLDWDWEDLDRLLAKGPEVKTLPASTPDAFVLRAEGAELTGPEVTEGTLIIVEPNLAEETGQYVLVSDDRHPVLRRLVLEGGQRQLRTLHYGQNPRDLSEAKVFPVTGCYKDLSPSRSPRKLKTAKSPRASKARRQ